MRQMEHGLRKMMIAALILVLMSAVCCAMAEGMPAVVLPETVKIVEEEAFAGTAAVGKVIIPAGVTEIRSRAFAGSAVTEVTLPASLTFIAEDAFDGCGELAVNVPEDCYAYDRCVELKLIEGEDDEETPAACFTYTISEGKVTITDYDEELGGACVVIPQQIEGYPVKYIGESAFMYCSAVTDVTIPAGVISIGDEAFRECSNLANIVIPAGVTTVGNDAFMLCKGLTHIDIPEGVVSIGSRTFYGCSGLTDMVLPDSLESFGERAFSDCTGLISIAIPEGVMAIPADAFSGCFSMTAVSFPQSMTDIGDRAFNSCYALQTVAIPEGVVSIGMSSFIHCYDLESVTLPDSLLSIGKSAFYNDYSLTSATIPNRATTIGENAFAECDSLTIFARTGSCAEAYATANSISFCALDASEETETEETPAEYFDYTISDGEVTIVDSAGSSLPVVVVVPKEIEGYPVRHIDDYVFYCAEGVTSITIPQGVISIGAYAFDGCHDLTEIKLPDSLVSIGEQAFGCCCSLADITIPGSITSIADSTFMMCSSLTEFTIPDSVALIGHSAFYECSALTSIKIPGRVVTIGGSAFQSCSSLQSVMIPASVTTIGDGAFTGCSRLSSISIPDGVTSIGRYAFSGCESLKSVRLPQHVMSIGYQAFYGCSGLIGIEIPASVASIDQRAFAQCTGLVSAFIPASVTKISNDAFEGCSGLTIYGPAGSRAESFAKDNEFRFVADALPPSAEDPDKPFVDLFPSGDHYRMLNAYYYDGNIYGEAVLTQEYNGVSANSFFFMTTQGEIVTDLELLCRLWTMRMYQEMENDIDSSIGIMHSSARIWSASAKDFMTCEAVWSSGGTAMAEVVKAYLNPVTPFLDLLKGAVLDNALDGGEVSAWMQIATIDQLLDYMDKMEKFNNDYSAASDDGIYMYDEVMMKLSLFVNYRYTYEVAKGLCIPVVEKVIDSFENNGEVFMYMVNTMIQETINGVFPVADACWALFEGCLSGDANSWDLIDILLTSMGDLNPVEQTFQHVAKAMTYVTETLSTITGISEGFVLEENEWLEPYFITPAELAETKLYQNHLLLAR